MLFQTLDNLKRQSIMTAIMAMALGIIMLICPENYVGAVIVTLGYVMIVFAIIQALEFLTSKKALINYIYFTGAVIVGVVGLSVLVFNSNVLNVLAWLFGFLLVADGCHSMFHAFTYARRSERKGWSVLVILSALLILFGIIIFVGVILFNVSVFSSPRFLMSTIGGVTLFSAVVSIVRLILVWPLRNQKGGSEDGKE